MDLPERFGLHYSLLTYKFCNFYPAENARDGPQTRVLSAIYLEHLPNPLPPQIPEGFYCPDHPHYFKHLMAFPTSQRPVPVLKLVPFPRDGVEPPT